MLVIVQRLFVIDGAQLGVLRIDGDKEPFCFVLEDEPREVKIAGETCIAAGRYELKLRTHGGMFERYCVRYPWNAPGMLELQGVRDFTDVLIHCGNHKGDTRGCLLVGNGAFVYGRIAESAEAYSELYKRVSKALLAGESVHIETRGANGVAL